MVVKVVTDSSADLPPELAKRLGVSVVPLYVRFGEEVYRERIDISEDEFYRRLTTGSIYPSTIQPSPQDFAEVYQKLSQEAEGIISIHISNKLSGTYNSALQAREMAQGKVPIVVIDSQLITMALGMVVIDAVNVTTNGGNLQQVVNEVQQALPSTRLLGLFDTLKYLVLGGRIGKAKALLGSVLNVKPLITLKDGEVTPAGQVRSRSKGLDMLYDFAKSSNNIQDLAILYNTTPNEAQALAERVSPLFNKERIRVARLGTTLGTHAGPGLLVIALREGKTAGSQ